MYSATEAKDNHHIATEPAPHQAEPVLIFIVFTVLQIVAARKRKSYLGYVGSGIEFAAALIFVIIMSASYGPGSSGDGIVTIPLILGAMAVVLLFVTLITNNKHKAKPKIDEIEKMNINDLD